MSKYIKAERLKKNLSLWDDPEAKKWKEIFEELVDAQPGADVEKIVKCEDCKWRTENECRLLKERDPDTDHRIWRGFFCAYGERRGK